jgi:hypothetical protein
MNTTHCTLIPAGTLSVRPLRYAVRIQIAAYGECWLSERMPVSAAKALRKELGI